MSIIFRCILCWLLATGSGTLAQTAGWKPERNVDIFTGTAAGGSLDKTARTLQRIIRDNRMLEVPFTVVNKTGGGGAVSWAYMNQKPGDGHLLSVTSVVLMTNRITGANPISWNDMTPIVQLMGEFVALTVKPDSPYKSGREFIEQLRKDPASIRFGLGTSLGGSSHIGLGLVAKIAGVDVKKLRYAIFKSGGEAALALIGGHVDVVSSSAGNYVSYMASGQMRSLGVTAPQRLGGPFAGTPTWREQGVDAVFSNWRGIVGPRGLSPAQIAFWESLFARAVKSDDWRKELDTNLAVPTFMDHRESVRYLESQYRELHAILSDLGLAK